MQYDSGMGQQKSTLVPGSFSLPTTTRLGMVMNKRFLLLSILWVPVVALHPSSGGAQATDGTPVGGPSPPEAESSEGTHHRSSSLNGKRHNLRLRDFATLADRCALGRAVIRERVIDVADRMSDHVDEVLV